MEVMRNMVPGDWPVSVKDDIANSVGKRTRPVKFDPLAVTTGGYELTWVGHVPDDVRCAVCNKVARDALEGECIHIFCATCVNTVRACPKCDEKEYVYLSMCQCIELI